MRPLGILISVILVTLGLCTDVNTTDAATAIPFTVTPKIPTFTALSFFGGLVIMLLFVVVPVGMMAYRNRNSIVEFIKNR